MANLPKRLARKTGKPRRQCRETHDELASNSDTEQYVIQSRVICGNSATFWRNGGYGYTCNLDEAWVVGKAKAKRICRDRPKEDIPRKLSDMRQLAESHVDVQQMFDLWKPSEPLNE